MIPDFTETNWNTVHQAGEATCSANRAALENLCRVYWPAIYAYLRRSNYNPIDAEDLTQGFFAHLLQNGSISHADPQKGRFRSFLLGALRHFLADAKRYQTRQRRGGGRELAVLDARTAELAYVEQASSELPPDRAYDRAWALAILEHSIVRLSSEYKAAGRLEFFEALSPFLSADPRRGEYVALAQTLGMKPETVAVAVHRLRKRFREVVRAEAAKTVANPADLEDELRHLAALFS